MTNQYWLEKWQNNDIKFNQEDVNTWLKHHYEKLSLSKSATIFIPLCGKSIDMFWLAQQGHNIIGVELSDIACRDFFAEHGLVYEENKEGEFITFSHDKIKLYCGDIFNLPASALINVNLVYDRACLIAFSKEIRERYVAHLHEILPPTVKILLLAIEYQQSLFAGPPYSVTDAMIKQYYADSFDISQLEFKPFTPAEHLAENGLTVAYTSNYLLNRM